jgi:uncharacterized protein (TIRG00374 family)
LNISRTFKFVRLAVSAGLIAFLLFKLDIYRIASHLKGLALLPLVLAALMDLLMIAVQAWRWDVLLKARGIAIRFARLFYYYLVSIFFSAFLPTSVGGDFARIVAVSRATPRRADAVASIVVERVLGFFVLIPVSLAAVPLVAGELKEWNLVILAEIVGAAIVLGFLVLLIRPVARVFSRVLDPLLKLFRRFRARERLERLYASIVLYRGSRRALLGAILLSVLSRVLWVCASYFVARAFSLSIGLPALFVIVPIIELVRMIPVSISGIGLREAAFAVMLKQFGVEYSLGVSFGIIVYVIFFVFALLGGVLYGLGSLRKAHAAGATGSP